MIETTIKRPGRIIFCIDTNAYAGNFERELCAFVTGEYGDCGVGKREAEEFEALGYEPFEDLIDSAPNEHGCWRPVVILRTPSWFSTRDGHFYSRSDPLAPTTEHVNENPYLTVGILMTSRPNAAEIQTLKDRAYRYFDGRTDRITGIPLGVSIQGFRILTETVIEDWESV